MTGRLSPWRESSLQKTADWLLSWVYDVTDGQIYTGQDHVNIIPHADNWEMKMMNNDFICGWYVQDGSGITTRIATDTVPQEHADKQHVAVEKARKAAMEYWEDNDLGEDYGTSYEVCPHCGDEYDPDWGNDHEAYCDDCDDYYYTCDWNNEHENPYCYDCGEHVSDLEDHRNEEHFTPEPGMPQEGEKIEYNGKEYKVNYVDYQGLHLEPWPVGGQSPTTVDWNKKWILDWDDYKEYVEKQEQEKKYGPQIEKVPGQTDFTSENPYLWQDYFLNQPTSSVNWTELEKPAIIHIVDLNDMQVFAKLAYDYLGNDSDVDWFNFHKDQQDQLDATQEQDPDWSWTDPTQQQQSGDAINQDQTFTPNENDFTPTDTSAQPDDPRMLSIARDWDSDEYRWSYDGHQLHMWRVFSRSAYGPSHYDMFGHDGYDNHSQGRVYVSEQGKVGMLYWQITHPECEAVLNEWCEKTFGKLPDYVYRAYGPYMGKPVSRWDFPIVEIGSLPLGQHERWWEQPGGYSVDKSDYPAKKQKTKGQQSLKDAILDRYNAGPVDNQGQPINPGKKKRRKRTRNRNKYRNRGFRR